MATPSLKEPYLSIYRRVSSLQKYKRYLAAYIFGSVARGEENRDSDFDVIVVVDKDNTCKEINHPIINGTKLDISYRSFRQIVNDKVLGAGSGKRIPMLAESIIIFDKTGDITKLRNRFKRIRRKKPLLSDYQFMQFMIYHADNKAKRNILTDKTGSLLAMGININEILEYHYHINGRWWVSNKRLLPDLRKWDPKLAKLVEAFVLTSQVNKKYMYWGNILDYVAKPLGGRKEISEINCNCKICKKDIALLAQSLIP